jgi:hypothetical protein
MSKAPFSEVVAELTALATSKPDQMAQCQYFEVATSVDDDEYPPSKIPCCIVGHFLASKGVTRIRGGELQLNGVRINEEGKSVTEVDWSALGYRRPGKLQQAWVDQLQGEQDSGHTWGYSLDAANDVLASLAS